MFEEKSYVINLNGITVYLNVTFPVSVDQPMEMSAMIVRHF